MSENNNSLTKEKQWENNAVYSPIQISFTGHEADRHFIDGELFGLAVNGTAKIFNNVSHLCFTGIVPEARTKRKFRMCVTPPEKGSVAYTMWAIMTFGEMSLYPQLYGELADFFVPEIVKAVYMKLINKTSEVERLMQVMREHRQERQEESAAERQHVENMQRMNLEVILQSQSRFLETIDHLASGLKTAAINSTQPIGRSCTQSNFLTINNKVILAIDEPMAEVIRSKDKLEVEDMKSYNCLVKAINIETGSAQLQVEGSDSLLHAAINDPILHEVGNVYTSALHNHSELVVNAKATSKNGKINKLFVSDAKFKS